MLSLKSRTGGTGGTGAHHFSTWILAPFWVPRLGLLLFHLGYLLFLLTVLIQFSDDELSLYIVHAVRDGGSQRLILTAVAIGVVLVNVVMEIFCIWKQMRGSLTPRFLLVATLLQSVLWTAIFVPSMILFHDGVLRAAGIVLT